MNLRQLLRRWLDSLDARPQPKQEPLSLPVVLALPADTTVTVRRPLVVSLEVLRARETVLPDQSAYHRPPALTYVAAAAWMREYYHV